MKKATLFFLMLALIATSSIAQTTMMYFKMEVDVPTYPDYKTRLKKGGSIHIDLGNDSTSVLYKDVALNNQLKKAETYVNSTDAMNYISKLGWNLVQVVSLSAFNYICIYKKEIAN